MTARNVKLIAGRKARGFTLIGLASAAGSTEARIVAFERLRYRPHPDEAQRIASAVGVPVGELFPSVRPAEVAP